MYGRLAVAGDRSLRKRRYGACAAVRPTFDLIDAQPDVTSAVVAANIESKGEVPISEVGFSYQEAGGEYVDVV